MTPICISVCEDVPHRSASALWGWPRCGRFTRMGALRSSPGYHSLSNTFGQWKERSARHLTLRQRIGLGRLRRLCASGTQGRIALSATNCRLTVLSVAFRAPSDNAPVEQTIRDVRARVVFGWTWDGEVFARVSSEANVPCPQFGSQTFGSQTRVYVFV